MRHRRAWLVTLLCLGVFGLTSCETVRHRFVNPSGDWQAKNGQLLYRGKKTKLIGEVLVRFSKAGDFELTFTKGPGVTLLEIRQDANFFNIRGPLAGVPWSGSTPRAPAHLRGWLQLREKLMASGDDPLVRHSAGGETFTFRF